ncbi:MAG: cation diffusion facilitator family transporter [Firmicutes bacterium]|nr:cation diffusion facilitator family transporter [Bacillota bacterium]MDD4263199.1 cation diffusion facilitator family transporter [Bacillota bacterium]MDD4694504.1 cation diffusion facilitator family transporter [Bacillota bacterium]
MEELLLKRFVKDYKDVQVPKVREGYGKLSSTIGVILNLLLAALKFTVGTFTRSIAITGDAVNNLSDAGSSLITVVSFKLAGKPADEEHPFGHARIEYIASSLVAVLILVIAIELMMTSISRIIAPVSTEFSIVSVSVLVFSIVVKLWLFAFNKKLGRMINSSMLRATAADSLTDVMATSVILVSTIISPLIGLQLDGYMGVGVSIFIMITGFSILRETLNRILGQRPSDELVAKIDSYIKQHEAILDTHDLVVHDYGPNRCFASVHAEVNASVDILESHDLIDNIERNIALDLGIHLVIHIDPIIKDDPYVNKLRDLTEGVVSSIDSSLSMHDFRVVKGKTHSNLVFDVTVPASYEKKDKELIKEISSRIAAIDQTFYAVITIDRAYTSSTNILK